MNIIGKLERRGHIKEYLGKLGRRGHIKESLGNWKISRKL